MSAAAKLSMGGSRDRARSCTRVEEGAAQVVVCPEDVEVNGVLRTSFNENLGILCSRVQQGGDALRVACRLQWQTTFCQAGIERCNNVWLCACCVCVSSA
jgi:hypothetical protein